MLYGIDLHIIFRRAKYFNVLHLNFPFSIKSIAHCSFEKTLAKQTIHLDIFYTFFYFGSEHLIRFFLYFSI